MAFVIETGPSKEPSSAINHTYFRDGKSRIDYVVVVLGKNVEVPAKIDPVSAFARTLQEIGVRLEQTYLSPHVFLKLHVPANKLELFAYYANIDIKNNGHFVFEKKKKDNMFQTELTKNHGDFFFRKEGEVTNAERILMLKSMMFLTVFPKGCSLNQLLATKLVVDAFPLHDGDSQFSSKDPDDSLNDRQYWGRFRLYYKEQPLNLVEKYYGSEVAFYFAWLGFYNVMLLPAAFIGSVMFIASVIKMTVIGHQQLDELCQSNQLLCPICHPLQQHCVPQVVKESCTFSYWTYIFDNVFSMVASVFMSLWAMIFLKLWRRRESTLRVRWNLSRFESYDTRFRPAFEQSVSHWRKMHLADELEPYMPIGERIWRQTLSAFVLFSMVLLSVILVFGIAVTMLVVKALLSNPTNAFLHSHRHLLTIITGSTLGVIVIKLYAEFLYTRVATLMTKMEKPRTQEEYDNSMLYKSYFLAFMNNNCALFYTAFIKGNLYKPQNTGLIKQIHYDVCHPSGCILGLTMQLSFILTLKSLAFNLVAIVLHPIKKKSAKIWKKYSSSTGIDVIGLEHELKLIPAPRLFLIKEYVEMVIQFGLITCYIMAQPLAPLFALVNNVLELRLDAKKLASYYRRPEPKRVSGIGEWNRILFGVALFSMVVNAFVLAFTSDFVPKSIYRTDVRSDMVGYINTTLTEINMNDIPEMKDYIIDHNNPTCYYRGRQYEPYHVSTFHHVTEDDHWYTLGIKFICVILFEHGLLLVNVVTTMAITEMPHWVKEYYTQSQRKDDQEHRKLLQKANRVVTAKDETTPASPGMLSSLRKSLTKLIDGSPQK